MLQNLVKVSIKDRFEIKIAESSQQALNLWNHSSLEIVKMGATSTARK